MTGPLPGDRVYTTVGATGRYIGDGLALVVSAQDNDLFIIETADGDTPPEFPPAVALCCGRHMSAWTGHPIVPGCQLCPNSPTYWRTTHPPTSHDYPADEPPNTDECGCCELHEYEQPADDQLDLACLTCGHTPEEHEEPE